MPYERLTSGTDGGVGVSQGQDVKTVVNSIATGLEVAEVAIAETAEQADAIDAALTALTGRVAAAESDLDEVAVAVAVQQSAETALNVTLAPEYNSIDPDVGGSVITGIGWDAFPNKIGAVSKPAGTDGTNAAEWADDTGYAAATLNDASVASINGGYDHINNQIAGTISGGGHNFIQYNSEGHSFIGGGSYNWIEAGRATILAGTNNRVSGDTYNAILSGFTNKILAGGHNLIAGGELNTINNPLNKYVFVFGRNISATGTSKDTTITGRAHTVANDEGSAVVGGQAHDLSGTIKCAAIGGNEIDLTNAQFSGVLGGDDITMTGALYSASVGGRVNVQTGRSSFMAAAEESNDNGARGLFTGRKAQGVGAYYQATIGCNHPTSGVLCQAMKVTQGVTTTGSNINAPTEQMITVGNTGLTTISGTCYVIARNTTDSKTAAYKVDFAAVWDGTNYFLNGVTADLAMSVIYEQAASNITAPTLAFSAGQLRVRFGGTASKTINWSASIDCILMRA